MGGGVKYKIIDIDGSEISLSDLLNRYFFNEKHHHTSCSVIETKGYNNIIQDSYMVYEQSKVTRENENTEQYSNESENNFIDDSKDTISLSKSCSSYRYTPQQIENLFVSDNGQEEDIIFKKVYA